MELLSSFLADRKDKLRNCETFFYRNRYADQMYEERSELKVQGAKAILALVMQPRNLDTLAGHESLIHTMSRELRENSKKSHDLAVSLSCVFLCFSMFTQFHPVLMQHQCGDAAMRILE